jgi:hypothetical protein
MQSMGMLAQQLPHIATMEELRIWDNCDPFEFDDEDDSNRNESAIIMAALQQSDVVVRNSPMLCVLHISLAFQERCRTKSFLKTLKASNIEMLFFNDSLFFDFMHGSLAAVSCQIRVICFMDTC